MKTQKQLLVTFDYELYLGNRSGFISQCMIEPTNELIKLLSKYSVRAVFFVDTTYLLRLKEQAQTTDICKKDFEKVASQLQDLVKKGHFVFPHIHPHWLDAEYVSLSNQWKLNNISKYRFHNITHQERQKVFDGSVNLLNEILHVVDPSYEVNGYRAGGWCIQPFGDFKEYFIRNGIKYEFSVLSGIYQFTDAQYFDFTDAPAEVIYRFTDNECKAEADGKFIQYSISSLKIPSRISFVEKIWLKILFRLLKDHTHHKGEGQPSRNINSKMPKSPAGKDLGNKSWERISVELLTKVKLKRYKKFIDHNKYMHFISHPKMITNHNLVTFETFLDYAFSRYDIETDFHKMNPGNSGKRK